MKKTCLLLILFAGMQAFSQSKDPGALLNAVRSKYMTVRDYTVDAKVVVDVWFLKIPDKTAKIYYKAPDKIHVETKGFALLPRKAAGFNPGTFIGNNFTALYMKSEKWGTAVIDVVKTVPNDANSDVILSTFWIDAQKKEIRKLEINSRSGGTFQVELEYNKLPFDLPAKIQVEFDVSQTDMPKSFTGEPVKKDKAAAKKAENKGKVTITYSNYRVNKGLDDKIFTTKK